MRTPEDTCGYCRQPVSQCYCHVPKRATMEVGTR